MYTQLVAELDICDLPRFKAQTFSPVTVPLNIVPNLHFVSRDNGNVTIVLCPALIGIHNSGILIF